MSFQPINTRDYTEVNAYSEMIIALRDAQRIARNWKFDAVHGQITDVLTRVTTLRDRLNNPRSHGSDGMETVALEWNEESTHRRIVQIVKGYNPIDDPNIYNELAMLDDPGQLNFDRYGITCTPVDNDPSAEQFIPTASRDLSTRNEPTS
ncbi:hypothetical protein [Mycobacteroides abscessus]|uniref:hypothetical protein n=1 Tax=Mycobacteroides abscessus TaxID=36809 RepID=UPI000928DDE4|nr:hypothetical protein [Mycobacteroides abscessus]SIC19518.1 Uncharacterised protein [Mycobacteroides abscessus subsp. abscessus]